MTPATDEGSVSVCLAFGVWCQWYLRVVFFVHGVLCVLCVLCVLGRLVRNVRTVHVLCVFVRVHNKKSYHLR